MVEVNYNYSKSWRLQAAKSRLSTVVKKAIAGSTAGLQPFKTDKLKVSMKARSLKLESCQLKEARMIVIQSPVFPESFNGHRQTPSFGPALLTGVHDSNTELQGRREQNPEKIGDINVCNPGQVVVNTN